jgi:hypothetical protein
MYDFQSRLIEPSSPQFLVDPIQLAAFIDAWEIAKNAYCEVLSVGIDRSDRELAQDRSYRRLLQAGLRIHRLGGSDTIGVVSACLERCHHQDGVRHLQRLWNGLLPEPSH